MNIFILFHDFVHNTTTFDKDVDSMTTSRLKIEKNNGQIDLKISTKYCQRHDGPEERVFSPKKMLFNDIKIQPLNVYQTSASKFSLKITT